jgi:hypothetical protein
MAWAFLVGPLFAWSPIKPGYDVIRHGRADVYFGSGVAIPAAYARIDEDIAAVEAFHALPVRTRMTVVICRDWSDCHRFVPWLRGELVGAVTIELFGNVIFVTPQVSRMGFDHDVFIRHELSHAVLLQNAALMARPLFQRAQWLYEGVAVLSAGPEAFGTWENAASIIAHDPVLPMFSTDPWQTPKFNIRSAYLVWSFFLEWVVDVRGRDTLQRLLSRFLDHPADARQLYQEVYGEPLESSVARFVQMVNMHRWSPAESHAH